MCNDEARWQLYAQLQTQLMRTSKVDDHAWSMEAGLGDMLVRDNAADELACSMRTHERRERHRARIRRFRLPANAADVEGLYAARDHLSVIYERLGDDEWALLLAACSGVAYETLASERSVSERSLRTHVSRLRQMLRRELRAA